MLLPDFFANFVVTCIYRQGWYNSRKSMAAGAARPAWEAVVMWTRSLLKQNAKNSLQGRYGRCILVCLVAGLLTGGLASGANNSRTTYEVVTGQDTLSSADRFFSRLPDTVLLLLLVGLLLGLVLSLAYSIFLAGPLQVGQNRYFMENRSGLTPWGTLWSIFRTPYLNVVKVQFLTGLKIVLGCLLIVPGIYWAYCYLLVPYLLAENPYLSTHRAMQLSRQMMDGEKFAVFVLRLSFLGWDLLCTLTMGIGFLFLAPYKQATYAELYAALRAKALAYGLSNTEELGGFVRRG